MCRAGGFKSPLATFRGRTNHRNLTACRRQASRRDVWCASRSLIRPQASRASDPMIASYVQLAARQKSTRLANQAFSKRLSGCFSTLRTAPESIRSFSFRYSTAQPLSSMRVSGSLDFLIWHLGNIRAAGRIKGHPRRDSQGIYLSITSVLFSIAKTFSAQTIVRSHFPN